MTIATGFICRIEFSETVNPKHEGNDMIKSLRTACAILFFSFCMIASAFAQVTVDEEKLREFVIQVMKDNPQLVFELYNQYASEMRAQQEDRQLEATFANRIQDTISESNPVKGAADAAVTIIEYSDFECPYCTRGANTAAKNPADVSGQGETGVQKQSFGISTSRPCLRPKPPWRLANRASSGNTTTACSQIPSN